MFGERVAGGAIDRHGLNCVAENQTRKPVVLIPHLRVPVERDSPFHGVQWKAGVAFAPFGVRIGVRLNDAQLLPAVCAPMLPDWHSESAPEVDHLYSIVFDDPSIQDANHGLYLGNSIVEAFSDIDETLDALWQSIHLRIGTYARDRIFVHAGVVGWNGRAIVMPGRTHAGKSTLVNAMVETGATYYSDEFAVIDPEGRVAPYPRALTLRGETRQSAQHLSARSLGWREALPVLPVGAVVVTSFRPGTEWDATQQGPGLTVLDLFANTVSARTNTLLACTTLARAAEGAMCFKGPRGEARIAADAILALLR